MHLEEFARGDSPVHRLAPRLKIGLAASGAVLLALASSPYVLAGGLCVALVTVGLARLNFNTVGRRLLVANSLLVLIWLSLPLTTPGPAALSLGPLEVSAAGIRKAGLITVRMNSILLLTVGLVSTIKATEIARALIGLHIPAKLVQVFFLTYRYLQQLHREFQSLRKATLMRGFKPTTSLRSYRTYAFLVARLFVRAHDRSKKVYDALRCRGYGGRIFVARETSFSTTDYLALGGGLVLIAAGGVAL